jgi:hypothetical protein
MCNPTVCQQKIEWLLSFDITISILLFLLIISLLVLLRFSQTATFNRLTLLPYYCLLFQSGLATFQYSINAATIDTQRQGRWMVLPNIIGADILNLAIAI